MTSWTLTCRFWNETCLGFNIYKFLQRGTILWEHGVIVIQVWRVIMPLQIKWLNLFRRFCPAGVLQIQFQALSTRYHLSFPYSSKWWDWHSDQMSGKKNGDDSWHLEPVRTIMKRRVLAIFKRSCSIFIRDFPSLWRTLKVLSDNTQEMIQKHALGNSSLGSWVSLFVSKPTGRDNSKQAKVTFILRNVNLVTFLYPKITSKRPWDSVLHSSIYLLTRGYFHVRHSVSTWPFLSGTE